MRQEISKLKKWQIFSKIPQINHPPDIVSPHVLYKLRLTTGGQRLNPASVTDIEKKSTFKNSRDGDRSDFLMRFG
jgi:hypothetical protein